MTILRGLNKTLYVMTSVRGLPGASMGKESAMQETQKTQIRSLTWEDPLEEGMATHSSTFAWRIPRTEEPRGLQSRGLQS